MTFKCEKCEKEFDEKTSFDQHTVAKHSPEAEKKESEKKVKKQTPNKSGGGKGKYIIGVLELEVLLLELLEYLLHWNRI